MQQKKTQQTLPSHIIDDYAGENRKKIRNNNSNLKESHFTIQ
jgi:hypothetical protein